MNELLLSGILMAALALVVLRNITDAGLLLIASLVVVVLSFDSYLGIFVGPFTLSDFTILLVFAGVLIHRQLSGIPGTFFLFSLFIAFGGLVLWREFGDLGSAARHAMAWPILVVAWFSARKFSPESRAGRGFAQIVVVAIAFQALVSVLQMQGMDVFATNERTAELTEGRMNGTFGHPGTLGKILIMFIAVLLPFAASGRGATRRWTVVGLILALVPIGLSLSRTNIVAVLAMLLLWAAVALKGAGWLHRLSIPAAAVAGVLVLGDALLARFAEDKEGGFRAHFMEVTVAHIHENWLFGVGSQGFVPYYGRYDSIIGSGWPVHNTFVLLVAELGVVGAALLLIPMIRHVLAAARRVFGQGLSTAHDRALLAWLPAVVAIGLTGWGMAYGAPYVTWIFAFGFLIGGEAGALRRETHNQIAQNIAQSRRPLKAAR